MYRKITSLSKGRSSWILGCLVLLSVALWSAALLVTDKAALGGTYGECYDGNWIYSQDCINKVPCGPEGCYLLAQGYGVGQYGEWDNMKDAGDCGDHLLYYRCEECGKLYCAEGKLYDNMVDGECQDYLEDIVGYQMLKCDKTEAIS
ncbi:MAG: hypothetical protein HQ582_25255 [Planctomycetes bacterium]|nr:hypothetical protein [Planctomycetota bacterium]